MFISGNTIRAVLLEESLKGTKPQMKADDVFKRKRL